MDKEEILKKVREAEEKDSFVKRCIRQHICPLCGEGFYPSDQGHPFSPDIESRTPYNSAFSLYIEHSLHSYKEMLAS